MQGAQVPQGKLQVVIYFLEEKLIRTSLEKQLDQQTLIRCRDHQVFPVQMSNNVEFSFKIIITQLDGINLVIYFFVFSFLIVAVLIGVLYTAT